MEEAKARTRRRHDRDLKAKVLTECGFAGASVAKVALEHGLNANLVHKWRREAARAPKADTDSAPVGQFVPVALARCAEPVPDIRIDLRRGSTAITVTWPMAAAADCASWMRELLR